MCYVRDVWPSVTKLDPEALKCVFSDSLAFRRGISAILLNLANIWYQMMWYFQRLHHFFYAHPICTSQQDEDEWLVYQVSHCVSPSPSSPIEHQSSIVPLPPTPSRLEKPTIVQVYSRRRDICGTCPPLISSSSNPFLLDPSETLTFLFLFV